MSERLVPDLARAVLDGTPIDWAGAESSADEASRPVLAELRVLAALADVHRRLPLHDQTAPHDRRSRRHADALGTPARARANRQWRLRRGVPGVGHPARSRGGAQVDRRGSSHQRRFLVVHHPRRPTARPRPSSERRHDLRRRANRRTHRSLDGVRPGPHAQTDRRRWQRVQWDGSGSNRHRPLLMPLRQCTAPACCIGISRRRT